MGFIDEIKARAKADKKTIVLPETEDERTYKAAETVLKEGIADLILIGSKEDIEKNKGTYDITGAAIVDPATNEKTESYIAKLVELREKKGMTEEKARELLLNNYLYYGVMMVKMGDADGMGIRCMPLYSGHASSLPSDPEDKTGNKTGICILPDGCSGLRYGSRRNVYLRRRGTGAESGSGETCKYRDFLSRVLPHSDRKRADCCHAFSFHQGKCKTSGCGQGCRGDKACAGDGAGSSAGRRASA